MSRQNPSCDVIIRADSSAQIGTGHVMRCLTLADRLRAHGLTSRFLCRDLPGNIAGRIHKAGFTVTLIDGPEAQTCAEEITTSAPRWVVLDHYDLGADWVRSCAQDHPVLAIDDLADRPHHCALLLDQNFGRSREDYDGLITPEAKTLIGPHYALLRPEFAAARAASLSRRSTAPARHLLINFGGADPQGITARVLRNLAPEAPNWERITIVMGPAADTLRDVHQAAAQLGPAASILTDVTDMARLMSESDVALGAAGSTSWERCCLGLPTGLLVLADNQREIAEGLHNSGAAETLADDLTTLPGFLARMRSSDTDRLAISGTAATITDGQGADRVARAMLEIA